MLRRSDGQIDIDFRLHGRYEYVKSTQTDSGWTLLRGAESAAEAGRYLTPVPSAGWSAGRTLCTLSSAVAAGSRKAPPAGAVMSPPIVGTSATDAPHPPEPAAEECSSGFRVQGSGFRVKVSGCRVQGSGFRVQGQGCACSRRVRGRKGTPRHLPHRVALQRRVERLLWG